LEQTISAALEALHPSLEEGLAKMMAERAHCALCLPPPDYAVAAKNIPLQGRRYRRHVAALVLEGDTGSGSPEGTHSRAVRNT